MEQRCGAADQNQSHRLSLGMHSPTLRFGPCNLSFCSFFAAAGRSTGVLFLAAQMQKELVARTAQRFGVEASCCFQAGSKQSLVDYAIADSVPCRSPYRCAVSSSPAAEGCFSMQVREWSCAAGLLMKTRAVVSVSGWIRPPLASARASPPAASSLPPATAPVFFSLQCSYIRCFREVLSGHLFVSRSEGKQSLLDLAIADSVSYTCAARSSQSSPAVIGCDAKLVRNPRCMAGRLITNRAIIQASGLICPRSAHDQRKCRALEGFVGVHSGKRLALVFSRDAHQSSSKQANHSSRCIRFQDLVHGAGMAVSKTLRPAQAARKRQAVLRSFRGVSRMWAPPGVAEPSPKVGMPRPSAAFMLRVLGGARAAGNDFRSDVGLETVVEANCAEVSPVEETLRLAQVPFVVMIRNLLPLLPSQALQGRQVLLDLVLVGQSHGGVIAHSMAQSLESAGFLVRGIVAADTLGLPRQVEMSSPRFDPKAPGIYLRITPASVVTESQPDGPGRALADWGPGHASREAECVLASG
eukprot:s8535_g2.t1